MHPPSRSPPRATTGLSPPPHEWGDRQCRLGTARGVTARGAGYSSPRPPGARGQFAVQLAKHAYGCTRVRDVQLRGEGGSTSATRLRPPDCVHPGECGEGVAGGGVREIGGLPPGCSWCMNRWGGELLKVAVSHLANKGRVLIMGSMGEYASGRWKSRGW